MNSTGSLNSAGLHAFYPCRVRTWEEKLVFGIMATFLMSSLISSILGARSNAKRTLAFEKQFCEEGEGLLWKQFTRLGKGVHPLSAALPSNPSSPLSILEAE